MPWSVIPLIATIATAGVGATELGMKLAGVGQPSPTEAKKAQEAAQLKQAQADADSKRKAILASLPNAQEQGGGSLTEPSLTSLASVIAGLPGEATTGAGRGALSDFLGTGQQTSGNENMVSATYGLSGSQG